MCAVDEYLENKPSSVANQDSRIGRGRFLVTLLLEARTYSSFYSCYLIKIMRLQ